tara:strand:- start:351 stop:695 length:345 start_codon:yes stop_codon:yes gene_type:complete
LIGRILILVMLLQLAITSVFAHGMVSVDQCAEQGAGHAHMVSVDMAFDTLVVADDAAPDLAIALHCTGQPCTEKMSGDLGALAFGDYRRVVLHARDPDLTRQSVLRPHLRPPLV